MSRRSSVVNSDSSSSSGKYQKGNKSALKSSVSKKDLLINRSRLASFGQQRTQNKTNDSSSQSSTSSKDTQKTRSISSKTKNLSNQLKLHLQNTQSVQQAELNANQRECNRLKKSVKKLSKMLGFANQKVEDSSKTNLKLSLEYQNMKSNFQSKDQAIMKLEQEVKRSNETNEILTQEITKLKNSKNQKKLKYQNYKQQMTLTLQEQSQKLQSLNNELSLKSKQESENDKKVNNYEENIEFLSIEIERLKQHLQDSEAKNKQIQEVLIISDNEKIDVSIKLNFLTERNQELGLKITELETDKNYLLNKSKEADSETSKQIIKMKEQYTSEIEHLSDQIQTEKVLMDGLQLENKKLLDLVELLRQKIQDSQNLLENDQERANVLLEKDRQINLLQEMDSKRKIRVKELEEQNNVIFRLLYEFLTQLIGL